MVNNVDMLSCPGNSNKSSHETAKWIASVNTSCVGHMFEVPLKIESYLIYESITALDE